MATMTQNGKQDHIEAPAHFVRFYNEDAYLIDEVADFFSSAFASQGVGVVIATPEHIAQLELALAKLAGVNNPGEWVSDQLIALDAAETLARFMVDGWPDEKRFLESVGRVVSQACANGKPVAAFGEMVALLCEQGLYDAAVRLEQLWTALAKDYSFSLFCAYPWHLFKDAEVTAAFQQICAAHDHVCSHSHEELPHNDNEVKRRLAELEQKTLALESEMARRAESERLLKEREQELSDFLENAAEGLHRVGPDGTILWANQAELDMLGYTWDEYVGRHIAEFHVDAPVIQSILTKLTAGETLYDHPARLRCQDGSIKHVVIHSNGSFKDGKLKYTRCFTRDATERMALEQAHAEREVLLNELTQANRSKDEFLAMLAHELRNPLAPIAAAAEVMQIMQLDEKTLKTTSQIISRQVKHMAGLVDDLLDASRVSRGQITINQSLQNFKSAVSNAIEQVRPLIEKHHHHLVLELAAEPAYAMGDQKRLVQIVTNLLNNAAKYTPKGGTIILRLTVHQSDIQLVVEDNGIGIEPELQPRIFDLFTQAQRTPDRSQGGLGIGLALVKKLAEMHGGMVTCHSHGAGQGSQFTVTIPRVDHQYQRSGHDKGAGAGKAARKLRLLVVDDNADAAGILALYLEAIGHEVMVEHSAKRALERIANEKPDACILDIGLPEMDGNELARSIRANQRTSNILLIAVTGYSQEQDRKVTEASGFDYHFVKPVDVGKLAVLLERFQSIDR